MMFLGWGKHFVDLTPSDMGARNGIATEGKGAAIHMWNTAHSILDSIQQLE